MILCHLGCFKHSCQVIKVDGESSADTYRPNGNNDDDDDNDNDPSSSNSNSKQLRSLQEEECLMMQKFNRETVDFTLATLILMLVLMLVIILMLLVTLMMETQ